MVALLRDGDGSKTERIIAWIISTLILLGIANVSYQFVELKTEVKQIVTANHNQDLCIKELQVNQQERIKRELKSRQAN